MGTRKKVQSSGRAERESLSRNGAVLNFFRAVNHVDVP